MLNGVDLRIRLTRAKNEFCLMAAAAAEFKLNLLGASLFIKKVTVSPAVRLGHSAALLRSNAIYPLTRTVIKSFTLAQGSRVCNQENLFLGNLPKYLIVTIVNHLGFSGAFNANPFAFEHANCEYMALSLDGRQIPAKAFQPRFDQGTCMREFYNLYLASGRHLKDLSLPIGREYFAHGYALFCLNLSCDDENDGVLSPNSTGSLRLEMRFRQALAHTYTLLVYATFDSILEINSRRQVLMDY